MSCNAVPNFLFSTGAKQSIITATKPFMFKYWLLSFPVAEAGWAGIPIVTSILEKINLVIGMSFYTDNKIRYRRDKNKLIFKEKYENICRFQAKKSINQSIRTKLPATEKDYYQSSNQASEARIQDPTDWQLYCCMNLCMIVTTVVLTHELNIVF